MIKTKLPTSKRQQNGSLVCVFLWLEKRCQENQVSIHLFLELQTTSFKWMFGAATIFHAKIWNHPIEATNKQWLVQVPGAFGQIIDFKH